MTQRLTTRRFTPRKIVHSVQSEIETMVEDHDPEFFKEGWRVYVVDQTRGRCYGERKVVTIPHWAFCKWEWLGSSRGKEWGAENHEGYLTWYICHELAHKYAGHEAKHGPKFMEWLKTICPAASQKFEHSYKPRNARAAGVSR